MCDSKEKDILLRGDLYSTTAPATTKPGGRRLSPPEVSIENDQDALTQFSQYLMTGSEAFRKQSEEIDTKSERWRMLWDRLSSVSYRLDRRKRDVLYDYEYWYCAPWAQLFFPG